jgi:hypothetical protein
MAVMSLALATLAASRRRTQQPIPCSPLAILEPPVAIETGGAAPHSDRE